MSGKAQINWREITAILGGTFDPPHLGHRIAAEGLLRNPGVQEVVILPSAIPPHKAEQTSAEHRLKMCLLNFDVEGGNLSGSSGSSGSSRSNHPIRVDDFEIQEARRKGTPNYTFETLSALSPRYGGKIAFVIGTDQLRDFPTWKRFPDVLNLSHWIVLGRRPEGIEKAKELLHQYARQGLLLGTGDSVSWKVAASGRIIQAVATEAPPISSTQIRAEIAMKGTPPADALHPEVLRYLLQNKLYGTQGEL